MYKYIKRTILVAITILLNLSASAQFYQNDPDLIQTKSGLKYKISEQGTGDFPKSGDRVWLHYYAKYVNDSLYDSSAESGPIDIRLGYGQLTKGWEEGIRLIKPGGAILLVVPPELGYGNTIHNNIPANSTLIFEIALLQVNAGNPIAKFNTDGKPEQIGDKKLRYYIVEQGSGLNAMAGDNAYIHFTCYLPDGTVFDTSYKNGEPIRVTVGENQVIKGLDMGLLLMNKGSKLQLLVPYKLAYGTKGLNNIVPPNTNITIDVELINLVTPQPIVMWNTTGKKIIETPSGLKYIIIESGDGELIKNDDVVEVHYSGFFIDSTLFDSSVKIDETLQFPVGANIVIEGWDEGIKYMSIGTKFRLIVPSNLGYGKDGIQPIIPPNTDLIFDIEVIDVMK